MDKVVHSCFGVEQYVGFESYIDELEELYHQLGWSETVKAHILFRHVKQYLASSNEGLGVVSEHGFEAIHAEFAKYYKNYERPIDHPEYQEKLLAAVISFNSMNLIAIQ